MSNNQGQKPPETDRYVVIHVATTCDEHGVYVTKDSAEVIEIGWLLLDAKTREEVCWDTFALAHREAHVRIADISRKRTGEACQYTNNSAVQ